MLRWAKEQILQTSRQLRFCLLFQFSVFDDVQIHRCVMFSNGLMEFLAVIDDVQITVALCSVFDDVQIFSFRRCANLGFSFSGCYLPNSVQTPDYPSSLKIHITLPNSLHSPMTMGDCLSEQVSEGIRVSNSRELVCTAEIYSKQLIQLLLYRVYSYSYSRWGLWKCLPWWWCAFALILQILRNK